MESGNRDENELLLPIKKRPSYRLFLEPDQKERDDTQLPTEKSICSRVHSDESHIDNEQKLVNLPSLELKLQKLTKHELRKEVIEKRLKQSDVQQHQNRLTNPLSNVQTEFLNVDELLLPIKKRPSYRCYRDLNEKESYAVANANDNDNDSRLPTEKPFCSRIYRDDCNVDFKQKPVNLPSLESVLRKFTKDGQRQAKVVIKKRLKQSDVKQEQNRLAIPLSGVQTEFLNEAEAAEIKKNGKIDVKVRGCFSVEVHRLTLSRWDYSGTGWKYVLNSGWDQFRRWNGLRLGDLVRVVAVRSRDGCLCLAVHGGQKMMSVLPTWGETRPRSFRGGIRKCHD